MIIKSAHRCAALPARVSGAEQTDGAAPHAAPAQRIRASVRVT